MKRKLASKKVGTLALASMLATSPLTVFAASDTSGHWAENVITKWENAGLINGFPDGTMRPDDTVYKSIRRNLCFC